ncbi:hypothetical protein MKX03_021953 [Papaver bracteatum]|nr:hypothetical protein MKX03_021953 [Papaver bracteatum]
MSRLLHAYANSKTNGNSETINSIPRELFTETLAKVASASLVDHFNANQRYGISNPEVSTFLKQCEEAQNPEVLYRKVLLQKSANLGHVVAAYVLGIILIDAGDDEEDVLRGKELLTQKSRRMRKRSRSGEIQECRKKAKKSIGGMWVNNSLSGAKKYSCNNLQCTARNQT